MPLNKENKPNKKKKTWTEHKYKKSILLLVFTRKKLKYL